MKATWELLISTVCAPARAAIARSATGGIALSLLATMYQLGSVFQPAGPDGVPRHDNVDGPLAHGHHGRQRIRQVGAELLVEELGVDIGVAVSVGHAGVGTYEDADVVVIGAGALGLSTALHCAMAGRSVAVMERRTAGSQASGRAAGLFKSVQADELRTRLARRSIAKAITFADWAGTPLPVAGPGSFLIARTARHRQFLRRELAQSRRWGADVREATRAQLAWRGYYQAGVRLRPVVPGGHLYRRREASFRPAWRPAGCTGPW